MDFPFQPRRVTYIGLCHLLELLEKSASEIAVQPVRNELRNVAIAFGANLSRGARLIRLPASIIQLVREESGITQRAWGLVDSAKQNGAPPIDIVDAIAAEKDRSEMWKQIHDPHPGIGMEAMAISSFSIEDPVLSEGVGVILDSVVIATWTAYETLAGDLWEAAVNSRQKFAFMALGAVPEPDDTEDKIAKKRRIALPIPLWMFDRPGFDPVRSLGTLIREHGKWEFSKREHIRDAYGKTFPDLKDELDKILSGQNLFWLSKLRNAIVHDAAKATPDFEACFEKHPRLRHVRDGQAIPIDGPIATPFIEAAILAGRTLLEKISAAM